jgi:hypothetical protein
VFAPELGLIPIVFDGEGLRRPHGLGIGIILLVMSILYTHIAIASLPQIFHAVRQKISLKRCIFYVLLAGISFSLLEFSLRVIFAINLGGDVLLYGTPFCRVQTLEKLDVRQSQEYTATGNKRIVQTTSRNKKPLNSTPCLKTK